MNKQQKTAQVDGLASDFKRARMALVSEYKGMTAAESDQLRRQLRTVSAEMRVAKNTLVRRAIKDTSYGLLDDKLGGPVGLILCYDDPVAAAKAVVAFKDAGERFKLRGGVIGGKPLSPEEVQALATMPPREVVMAQLLGLLQASAGSLVRLLNEPGSALVRVIDAIGKKNSQGVAEAPTLQASAEAPPA
jgi:large subunit ribosomal protein L10